MKTIPIRRIPAAEAVPRLSDVFRIRKVETILGGRDMLHELHRHDYFFVLAMQKGSGKHTIDFTAFDVGDRSVFFLRPGQVHELMLKKGSRGYLMEFSPAFYRPADGLSQQLLRQASGKNHCQLGPDRFKRVQQTLSDLYEEATDPQPHHEEAIRWHLGILFIELVRNRQHAERSRNNGSTSYGQERLEEFQDLLEKHVSELKKVSDYADRLNLSPYQLNAITKAALGKTASELIDECIILEAKRYLTATSNQVNQIAHLLGYEDSSYFIRFFKKHTGQSPDSFRKNFK